jgi:hypothetical protein
MTISLLARRHPRLGELTVSSVMSYTLLQISRVTRVTGRAANAVRRLRRRLISDAICVRRGDAERLEPCFRDTAILVNGRGLDDA